jgi:hypothetical protein
MILVGNDVCESLSQASGACYTVSGYRFREEVLENVIDFVFYQEAE